MNVFRFSHGTELLACRFFIDNIPRSCAYHDSGETDDAGHATGNWVTQDLQDRTTGILDQLASIPAVRAAVGPHPRPNAPLHSGAGGGGLMLSEYESLEEHAYLTAAARTWGGGHREPPITRWQHVRLDDTVLGTDMPPPPPRPPLE